jgi:hypothetical protein
MHSDLGGIAGAARRAGAVRPRAAGQRAARRRGSHHTGRSSPQHRADPPYAAARPSVAVDRAGPKL